MLPLHNAIEHLNEQELISLLQSGADPNQPDPSIGGFRPLHLAVDIECEDACSRYDKGDHSARPVARLTRILIEAGANPNLPDEKGMTAKEIAKERAHKEALDAFSIWDEAHIGAQ